MGSFATLDFICAFYFNFGVVFSGRGFYRGNRNDEEAKMKWLVVLMALSFVGCHKKSLDQCQVNLAEQKQVNDVLSSKVKDCRECLPCPCATPVSPIIIKGQVSKDDVCDYYKSLYSNALHQYRKELKECLERR